MSQFRQGPNVSFKVNQATTLSAYRIVKPAAGNNSVALWDTATAHILGVTLEDSKGATGTSVLVAIYGTARLGAGASVSAGALVTGQTATGLGIEDASRGYMDTATAIVAYTLGIALDAADTNSVFEVLIRPSNLRFDFV